jgi:hypothetical protein
MILVCYGYVSMDKPIVECIQITYSDTGNTCSGYGETSIFMDFFIEQSHTVWTIYIIFADSFSFNVKFSLSCW